MKGLRRLERATTDYLVPTSIGVVVAAVAGFWWLVARHLVSVDTLAKFVDIVAKSIAVSIGALWALNRYFVGRTDARQLRVDAQVDFVSAERLGGRDSLMVYRLDLVNTGRILIQEFHQYLVLDAIRVIDGELRFEPLFRWPAEGLHPGGPIEPGSWVAINSEQAIPKDVHAVRIYLEVHFRDGMRWNWHRSFALKGEAADG